MTRASRSVLFAILSAVAFVTVQAKTPLSAEKMWSLKRLGDPAISPDGKLAVVPVTHYDVKENKGFTDLWSVPTAGGPARQLTSDAAADTSPTFSPDGRWIAFVSKRGTDEQNQIYVIAVDGGEARRVTNIPTGAGIPKWFPDSQRIAFVSEIWGDLTRWEDQVRRVKERADSKMSAKVWNRAPIAYWDHHLDDREPHVFSIALEGGEPTAITRMSGFFLSKNEYDAFSYDVSPDGEEIAIATNTDKTGVDPNFDIVLLASCGCKPARNLSTDNPSGDDEPRYSPDGRHLVWLRQEIKGFYADRQRLMLHERAPGKTRELTENWDRSADNLVWLPDGKGLLGAIDDAATQRIYRFDLKGTTPKRVTTTPSFHYMEIGRASCRERV